MSDNLNKNDYSEYFKTLEHQLSKKDSEKIEPEKSEPKTPAVPKHSGRTRSNRFYKVIKLKPLPVVLSLLFIMGIMAATLKLVNTGRSEKIFKETEKPKNDVEYITEKNSAVSFELPEGIQGIPDKNDAQSAIIVDTTLKKAVAAKNPHTRMYPASTTKIMTLLTAADNIKNFDDTFTMTLDITDPLFKQEASVAGFLNGEEVTMTDLLYGAILPSGADATMGLAIKISGSEAEFVKLMNKKATEMGLCDTHFVNTTGLFDKDHYTSVYDMSVILETALQNPLCKKILSTYQYTTAKTPQHPNGILLTSTLFSTMYGTEPETATVLGGKTGFVYESGYCIASFGKSNTTSKEYIVVTFKNSARWPAVYGQIDLYKQFVK